MNSRLMMRRKENRTMENRWILHACISRSMAGTVRSGYSYAQLGTKCEVCGAMMEEKYEIKPIKTTPDEAE